MLKVIDPYGYWFVIHTATLSFLYSYAQIYAHSVSF